MENVINLIISICTLIVLIGGLIPTGIDLYHKIKEIIKNKDWKAIGKMILEGMSAAEAYAKEHPGMTGQDKLNMCLDAVKASCASQGIELDEKLIKDIISEVEKLIGWSKTVNAK